MLEFTVYGKAKTKGSTTSFIRGGKVITKDAAGAAGRNWEQSVAAAALLAREEAGGKIAAGEPVAVEAVFFQPRNKGDFGTGRNASRLKPSAPDFPATRPDVDKYLRRLLDGLTGILYADDGQVVTVRAEKRWGDPPRVEVKVWVVQPVAEDGQETLDQLELVGVA
jgi:Holliday junction resolvase RusA-like endonuclease